MILNVAPLNEHVNGLLHHVRSRSGDVDNIVAIGPVEYSLIHDRKKWARRPPGPVLPSACDPLVDAGHCRSCLNPESFRHDRG